MTYISSIKDTPSSEAKKAMRSSILHNRLRMLIASAAAFFLGMTIIIQPLFQSLIQGSENVVFP
ncbi:hypothetical protein [Legionella sp.]|uniref:hypothetical protein n=1 Tax=Legionella sp. TaxID=459 RepID=UPI003CAD739A